VSPRTRQSLIVAAAAVGIAAIGGIAAIAGWLPDWASGEAPASAPLPTKIIGIAPPETLSPGESVITGPPADPPPQPAKASRPCPHCGTISSTAYHEREPRNARWEVRVRFDDGSRKILRYPTDPGFRVGDRVSLAQGRLRKD